MTRVAGVRVMYVHALGHSPRFADRVAKMLERVEHRAAVCTADRKAAYRLRYEAYLRENLLNQRLDAMLYDEVYDASPNSLTTVTYVDGELASTVRVHLITDQEGVSPARDVFPDVVTPYLRAQRVIIDPSRLAARADMARRFPDCRTSPSARRGWRRIISRPITLFCAVRADMRRITAECIGSTLGLDSVAIPR
jgi:hypothetical protein